MFSLEEEITVYKKGIQGLVKVKDAIYFELFIGIDVIDEVYKEYIYINSKSKNLYILDREGDKYVISGPLYTDLYEWVDLHISDIVKGQRLFPEPILISINKEDPKIVSIRDILKDSGNREKTSNSFYEFYDLADLITSKIESKIQELV